MEAEPDYTTCSEAIKLIGEPFNMPLTAHFIGGCTIGDQFDRDYDEYELETESSGRVYQLIARYSF